MSVPPERAVFDEDIARLCSRHQLSRTELARLLRSPESVDRLPLAAFTPTLSPLETAVKALSQAGKRPAEIARALGKRPSAIWTAAKHASAKHPAPLDTTRGPHDIPLEAIHRHPLSLLEAVVTHLKEQEQLAFREIGRLLHRDERTVWTVYARSRQKRGVHDD